MYSRSNALHPASDFNIIFFLFTMVACSLSWIFFTVSQTSMYCIDQASRHSWVTMSSGKNFLVKFRNFSFESFCMHGEMSAVLHTVSCILHMLRQAAVASISWFLVALQKAARNHWCGLGQLPSDWSMYAIVIEVFSFTATSADETLGSTAVLTVCIKGHCADCASNNETCCWQPEFPSE